MKKLILFGDSLFGRAGKHRLIMLEDALPGYDVYNCAAGGWDTNDCVSKAPYISKLEPDVLVISLGTNDAAPWRTVLIEKYSANILEIIETFDKSKVIYFLPPPVDEKGVMRAGKQISNQHVQPYYEAAKKVCQEKGTAYIDSFKIFLPMLKDGEVYHEEDGVHLEDVAYQKIWAELAMLLV